MCGRVWLRLQIQIGDDLASLVTLQEDAVLGGSGGARLIAVVAGTCTSTSVNKQAQGSAQGKRACACSGHVSAAEGARERTRQESFVRAAGT